MTNKITKVYKNGVEYDIYASGGAAGTGDVTGPSSSTDADIALFSGATGKIIKDSGKKLSDYQTALSTQTAYSSKGTATKVPTITTNTLGQVTGITETNISFPVTSVNGNTGAVTVSVPTKVSDLQNDAGYTTNTGTITSVKMNGSTVSSSGEADLGTVITSHQSIKTLNSTSLVGTGNVTVNEVPSSGTTGHVLTKTANGYGWAAASGGIENVTTGTTSTVTGIWAGSENEYSSLSSKSGTVLYFTF